MRDAAEAPTPDGPNAIDTPAIDTPAIDTPAIDAPPVEAGRGEGAGDREAMAEVADGNIVDMPPIVPSVCGDGTVQFPEQCDDGNDWAGDGCSPTCQIETGYVCVRPGQPCTKTTCGDGKKEGTETCDDGNTEPFDGCSEDCQIEPNCSGNDGCTSQCGDGLVIGEECDDGNNVDGDGCSSTCKIEPGWACVQPPMGDTMKVPAIYRDFRFSKDMPAPGNDFENGFSASFNPLPGIVKGTLAPNGKPVYTGLGGAAHILSTDSFTTWYQDTSGVNHPNAVKLTLWSDGKGNYVNRYGADGGQWNVTTPANYCGTEADAVLDASGIPIPCSYKYEYDPNTNPTGGKTDCKKMEDLGYTQLAGSCHLDAGIYRALYVVAKADGNPVFFPVDGDSFTPASELVAAVIPPYYDASATWPYDLDAAGNKRLHNFSFTSEIRYFFRYDKNKTYTLDFVGDDDLWVFIAGKLAADVGGIHPAVDATIVLEPDGNAATTVTATYPVSPAPTPTKQTANLGLQDGGTYEIAVFHAERQSTSSSLKVMFPAFNSSPSACTPCKAGVCAAASAGIDVGATEPPSSNH